MHFTILGGSGFIGSYLGKYLTNESYKCTIIKRNDSVNYQKNLGHLIYCIGVTSDFRDRFFDTIEAHVCYLMHVLKNCRFDSFTYLSSTRVYENSYATDETIPLSVNPAISGNLYNLSKLMGESICLNSNLPNIKIIRISNIVGAEDPSANFLTKLFNEAINGHIELQTTLNSEKDYLLINDLARGIKEVILKGKLSIYNIASGTNISHLQLITKLKEITNCTHHVKKDAVRTYFPVISISRIKHELGFKCSNVLEEIGEIIFERKNASKFCNHPPITSHMAQK